MEVTERKVTAASGVLLPRPGKRSARPVTRLDLGSRSGATGVPEGQLGRAKLRSGGRANRYMLFHRVEFSSRRSDP